MLKAGLLARRALLPLRLASNNKKNFPYKKKIFKLNTPQSKLKDSIKAGGFFKPSPSFEELKEDEPPSSSAPTREFYPEKPPPKKEEAKAEQQQTEYIPVVKPVSVAIEEQEMKLRVGIRQAALKMGGIQSKAEAVLTVEDLLEFEKLGNLKNPDFRLYVSRFQSP